MPLNPTHQSFKNSMNLQDKIPQEKFYSITLNAGLKTSVSAWFAGSSVSLSAKSDISELSVKSEFP